MRRLEELGFLRRYPVLVLKFALHAVVCISCDSVELF